MDKYLTLEQAAQRAGLRSANGVRRWVTEGLLPSYKREGSRRVLVRTDELDAFLGPKPVQR